MSYHFTITGSAAPPRQPDCCHCTLQLFSLHPLFILSLSPALSLSERVYVCACACEAARGTCCCSAMELMLKEGWLCWLDMVGSAGEKPKAAGWQGGGGGGMHLWCVHPLEI